MKNLIYISDTANAHKNLARDEVFIDTVTNGELVLYFYVNAPSVIIGKNQNPWKECDLAVMERDGVMLVRRITGGGAVYHDCGNLNFSFIGSKDRYDAKRQFSVIARAVSSFGINCELSGRNDLTCAGKKFSGNAFSTRLENSQHHGTLLVNTDLSRLSGYLSVDERKIRSKGIDSVRSRVCNLSDFSEKITVPALRDAIIREFSAEYGAADILSPDSGIFRGLDAYEKKHSSPEWLLGQTPKFDIEFDERFPWGGIQLFLSLEKGKIVSASAFSDALDTSLCETLEKALIGSPFLSNEMKKRIDAAENPQLSEFFDSVKDRVCGL